MRILGVYVNDQRQAIVCLRLQLQVWSYLVGNNHGLEALYISGWRTLSLCVYVLYSMMLSIIPYYGRKLFFINYNSRIRHS